MGDTFEDISFQENRQDGQVGKQWTVLVTGYGVSLPFVMPGRNLTPRAASTCSLNLTKLQPFLEKYPINSSWVIASTLPNRLPATSTSPSIRIIKHPEPIKTAYRTVMSLVPKLLQRSDPKPDIILHLGLAVDRHYYSLERESPREPYTRKRDLDGHVCSSEENKAMWGTCPNVLKPTFNCDDVWRRWQQHVQLVEGAETKQSDDPGNFMCAFIYYASMAWFWKRGAEERPVMFLHVPDCPTEEEVEVGREVTAGLVKALVESRETLGIFDPLKKEGSLEEENEL